MAWMEPALSIIEKTSLIIARTLFDTSKGSVPMRIINVTDDTRVLYRKTTAALGEPVTAEAIEVRMTFHSLPKQT